MQSGKLQPKIFKSEVVTMEPSSQSQEFNNTVYYDPVVVSKNCVSIPVLKMCHCKKIVNTANLFCRRRGLDSSCWSLV